MGVIDGPGCDRDGEAWGFRDSFQKVGRIADLSGPDQCFLSGKVRMEGGSGGLGGGGGFVVVVVVVGSV